jgi:hypothetical protein
MFRKVTDYLSYSKWEQVLKKLKFLTLHSLLLQTTEYICII